MKLSEWARAQGISRQTGARWFHAGILPVPARQLPTGTILVDDPKPVNDGVAIYARVSSADQKADLDRQVARLTGASAAAGLAPTKVVTEIGSALNGSRPKLKCLLSDPKVNTIVIEHRDRLARFGVEYLEAALRAQRRRLVVDDNELKDDLVRDMVEVLTSFCARLYGRRSAGRRAKRAVAATASDRGGAA